MTAALLHQFAAEGRLSLTDRVSDAAARHPAAARQRDHSPASARPCRGPARRRAAVPRRRAVDRLCAGRALALFEHRLRDARQARRACRRQAARPAARGADLRAARHEPHRGAIIGADRTLYAQGYEAADQIAPFARGVPLAPAAWVDVTFGAGSVASTADDMTRFLRSLADAAQGRGGLGLSPQQAKAFTTHAVPSDTPGMSYGNGLMHVGNGRPLLPPPHRRDGELLLVLPRRRRERRRRVRELDHQRLRRISAAPAHALRGRCADQRAGRASRCPRRRRSIAPLANAAAYVGRYSGPGGRVRGPRRAAR